MLCLYRGCRALRRLEIFDCVVTMVLLCLYRGCRSLRRLEIFDCQMVSRAGIHKLGVWYCRTVVTVLSPPPFPSFLRSTFILCTLNSFLPSFDGFHPSFTHTHTTFTSDYVQMSKSMHSFPPTPLLLLSSTIEGIYVAVAH